MHRGCCICDATDVTQIARHHDAGRTPTHQQRCYERTQTNWQMVVRTHTCVFVCTIVQNQPSTIETALHVCVDRQLYLFPICCPPSVTKLRASRVFETSDRDRDRHSATSTPCLQHSAAWTLHVHKHNTVPTIRCLYPLHLKTLFVSRGVERSANDTKHYQRDHTRKFVQFPFCQKTCKKDSWRKHNCCTVKAAFARGCGALHERG